MVHVVQNTEIQKILEACLRNNPRKDRVTAFIDVAGFFKDYDNLHTAEQILKYFKESSQIECVLFFGRTAIQTRAPNTLMALKKGNPVPIIIGSTLTEDLQKHGINPESTFIYYDECHCEATDLPQGKDAANLLSSNASIILRDLLQGMLRARGFLKNQDIEYVVHENTIKQLRISSKPTFESAVLNPSIMSQAERKAKETYRAFLHEIDHVLCKCAWEHVLDVSDSEEMITRFEQYRVLFLHNSEMNLFKQYGNLLQKEVGLQALKNRAQQRLQQWKQIQPDLQLQEKVQDELTQVIQRASACKFLPNLIQSKLSELGKEQEVELEQELEQRVDTEIEKELETYQPKEASTFKEYLSASPREDMWLILPNGDNLSPPLKDISPLNIQQELVEHADWLARTLWFINFFNGNMSYLAEHADLTKMIIKGSNTELKTRFLQLKTTQDLSQKSIFRHMLQHVLEDSSKDTRLEPQQCLLKKRKKRTEVGHFTRECADFLIYKG